MTRTPVKQQTYDLGKRKESDALEDAPMSFFTAAIPRLSCSLKRNRNERADVIH
jgi:hypothetical protein